MRIAPHRRLASACPGLHRAGRVVVLALLVRAATANAASVSVADGAVVLGRTEAARVQFRVEEAPGTESLPLRLSVNVGSFSEPVRLGPGRFSALYVPPTTRFPQVALVAVWRETGPSARIDFLRIPLFGQARVPVMAHPGAEVVATVGPDRFGPVRADRRGRAEVPILVPPEVTTAAVTITEPGGGRAVQKEVALEAQPYNRLTAALVPHAVVADGASTVRIDVFYDRGGVDLPPDRVRVLASLGTATFTQASNGRYSFLYVAPAATEARFVDFAVSVTGDPLARAAVRVDLGATVPEKVIVTGPDAGAPPSAQIPVQVLVLDAAGMGLPGIQVTATANGQPLPPPVDRGAGLYAFAVAAPSVFPQGGLVQFRAEATALGRTARGSVNWSMRAAPLPRQVLVRFEPSPVPADGRTAARLLLDVRDASGAPLEHVRLLAVASDGSAGPLQERGAGLYESRYVPPASLPGGEARLRVVDGTGQFEQAVPIPLQRPSGRVLLGLGAGYAASPGAAAGPRAGADLLLRFGVGAARLSAGLAVTAGTASRTVRSPDGGLSSTTRATLVPVALRIGWEAWSGRRLSLTAGGGGVAAWARFRSTLAGAPQQAVGLGWTTFGALGWSLGWGQATLDVSYGACPVETRDYRADPGGLAVQAGYRVRIL